MLCGWSCGCMRPPTLMTVGLVEFCSDGGLLLLVGVYDNPRRCLFCDVVCRVGTEIA
jgi:hypothetical protein